MAVTLRYFTEFGKPVFQHITASICGRIYARVCCILYCVYDVVVKKVHVRYFISCGLSAIAELLVSIVYRNAETYITCTAAAMSAAIDKYRLLTSCCGPSKRRIRYNSYCTMTVSRRSRPVLMLAVRYTVRRNNDLICDAVQAVIVYHIHELKRLSAASCI